MGEKKVSKLFVPSLSLSRTAPQARGLLSNFLLIEIAQTYGLSLGVTNQITTITSFVGIFAALLMGFLSVKYRHKILLVTGLGIVSLSMFGCYLAPSFITLVFFYAIGGIGANMTMPIATALIGAHIPKSDRSKALGLLFAVPATLYLVGPPVINYIDSWRNSFLLFALPLTLITLLLCMGSIPQSELSVSNRDVLGGYKGVFKSNSAIASLVGNMLGSGVWMIFLSLSISLFRQEYGMSRAEVTSVNILMSLSYIGGAMVSRSIIPKLGIRSARARRAMYKGPLLA
jgi:predicted MFS family arabinose efflux permease